MQSKCPRCGYKLLNSDRGDVKKQYAKAFTPWSLEDMKVLKEQWEAGTEMLVLVEMLQRPDAGILQKVERLGLVRGPARVLGASQSPVESAGRGEMAYEQPTELSEAPEGSTPRI